MLRCVNVFGAVVALGLQQMPDAPARNSDAIHKALIEEHFESDPLVHHLRLKHIPKRSTRFDSRAHESEPSSDLVAKDNIEDSEWNVQNLAEDLRRLTMPERSTNLDSHGYTSKSASYRVASDDINHAESEINEPTRRSHSLGSLEMNLEKNEDFVDDSDPSGNRRGFICLTGQLARVEVESKIENIVKPMKNSGFGAVDLVFVVDSQLNHRTNAKRKKGNSKGLRSVEFFKNSTTLLDAVERSSKALLDTVRYVEADHLAEVDVSMRYVRDLDSNYQESDMAFAKQRAQNHARQYKQYQGCLDAIKENTVSAGAYDIIVRVRDDLYVAKPINIAEVMETIVPNSIITSKCDQNLGINDKGALVHPSAAERYFMLPLKNLNNDAFLRSNKIINPEQFLKRSYTDSGLKIRVADVDTLFWLPEAIDSSDSVCVYSCEFSCYGAQRNDIGMRQCVSLR
jgi:hypothetical protein